MDPILLRGLERLLIVAAATFTIYLGYRLFCLGVTGGPRLDCKTAWGRFVVGGSGPGLALMAWGCTVLVYALVYGGALVTHPPGPGPQPQVLSVLKSLPK